MIESWILNSSATIAYIAFAAVVFAESGILIGFFLPGDSLLFTLGLIASQGHLNIAVLLILGCVAAVVGDSTGYYWGRKIGPRVFSKDNKRRWLNHEHLEKTQAFYEKHGVKTIFLARFTPFVRTLAPILAGVSEMDYRLFATYNVLGGLSWVGSVLLVGYYLGRSVKHIDQFMIPIIGSIIIVTAAPAVIAALRSRKKPAPKA